jgi:hypothetical protein
MKRRIFIKQVAWAGAALVTGVAAVKSMAKRPELATVPFRDIPNQPGDTLEMSQFRAIVKKMKEADIPPDENGNYYMLSGRGINMLGVSSSGQPYVQIGTGPTPLLKEI